MQRTGGRGEGHDERPVTSCAASSVCTSRELRRASVPHVLLPEVMRFCLGLSGGSGGGAPVGGAEAVAAAGALPFPFGVSVAPLGSSSRAGARGVSEESSFLLLISFA